MRCIHIPNLFYIQGQPYNGKSTLARHFRQSLDCDVIPTDLIFWRWCDKYHPHETRKVRQSIGLHFKKLPQTIRREWFEYLVKYILSLRLYAQPDMVIEGWLLTLIPKELKDLLRDHFTIFNITMQRYVVRTALHSFNPTGTDYTNVVQQLKAQLKAEEEKKLMARVEHQRYEEYKHCPGRSDTKGRLAIFKLPDKLVGKRVLEIGSNTGYFAIRCAQRGATVYAIDQDVSAVKLSSRIANAIYRLTNVRFHIGDILTEDFYKSPKFDYVLLINGMNKYHNYQQLLQRAEYFLAPGGKILTECLVSDDGSDRTYKDTSTMYCPTEDTIKSWLSLPCSSSASVGTSYKHLTRTAFTFGETSNAQLSRSPSAQSSDDNESGAGNKQINDSGEAVRESASI